MHERLRVGLAFLILAGAIFCAGPTAARAASTEPVLSLSKGSGQGYPTKPIRLIVPFSPGGLADIVARIIAQPAAQLLGQSIIVDNRPGADGAIAGSITVKAAPDGYTLFFATSTAMSAVPTLRKLPPYNPVSDFTPITDMGRNIFFMYVHPSLPVRTLPELINHIRAYPGKLNYGSISSTSMVATAQILLLYKLDAVRIPYNGEAAAIPDMVSGRIQFGFMSAGPGYAQAREGKLRVLATLTPTRSSVAPDVPTLEEAGVKGVTTSSWGGLFGPARMPAPVVERLSREFRVVLSRPDIADTLGRQGFIARGSPPAELAAYVEEQIETWSRIVREAGIPVE
jgi:tripartite-type tricarboxylate transporter receptor subunit TctC